MIIMQALEDTAYIAGYVAYNAHAAYDSALAGCWKHYVAEQQQNGIVPTVAAQLLYRTHFKRGWNDAREDSVRS